MSDELLAAKRRLRRQLLARRRALPPGRAAEAAAAVLRHLEAWPVFRKAHRVALYAALPDELPTRPCFEALRAGGRTPLLPAGQEAGRLVFRPAPSWDALRPGAHRVLEPPAESAPVALGPGDLVLVPGVAFDPAGHRLGRGGGHYDATFPPGAAGPLLCGVAYEFQVLDSVPHGSHDRRMDAIVTERRLRGSTESG